MKKLLATCLLTFLLIFCLGVMVQAQTPTYSNVLFGGGTFETEKESFHLMGGVGKKLTGNLWSFNYVYLAKEGSFNSEMVLFLVNSNDFRFGITAGPNVDWTVPQSSEYDEPILAYIVGASGITAVYDMSERTTIYGYGKYKFDPISETLYKDKYAVGAGIGFRF